ncbi:MAG: glycosyltransferase family 2 protein [Candidatus Micrarchaeota archaeon]|nr:glycosyltransferase family 2 protein [Candidatus Micrarchaeota archaeon]
MASDKISVILPVHNEEKVLEQSIRRIEKIMLGLKMDFEIIISEDGSTDRTFEIMKSLESERIRIFQNRERLGKGKAIKNSLMEARGNIVIFMDADLASKPEQIEELIKQIRNGAAIVIGSRYVQGSKVKRTAIRNIASIGFNWLVRNILNSKLKDHQCGFKAFRKDAILPLANEVENRQFFWDTELLVLAQRKGLKIVEIPIEWNEGIDSKFNLIGDTFRMACGIIDLKMRKG